MYKYAQTVEHGHSPLNKYIYMIIYALHDVTGITAKYIPSEALLHVCSAIMLSSMMISRIQTPVKSREC